MWVPNLPVTLLSGGAAVVGIVCLYKDMRAGPAFDKEVRAAGLTVVVTGANTGIGKETAWEFAKRGAKVFMACRDMTKCEAARRDIVLGTDNRYVYCRPCDLASTASVREFVRRFKAEEPRLDVLVNNAGVMQTEPRRTSDGFEENLGVNHLGHFLLTNLLLDELKAAAGARVVVVTSGVHKKGSVRRADLNMEREFSGAAAYNQSKLANVLFARELARRLLGSKVSVAAVDPELTSTELTRHLPVSRSLSRYLVYPLFWPGMKTPRAAAQSVLHAALAPAAAASLGDYYVRMEKTEPSKEAQDFELAQWLWRVSEKWTRLAEHRAALDAATS